LSHEPGFYNFTFKPHRTRAQEFGSTRKACYIPDTQWGGGFGKPKLSLFLCPACQRQQRPFRGQAKSEREAANSPPHWGNNYHTEEPMPLTFKQYIQKLPGVTDVRVQRCNKIGKARYHVDFDGGDTPENREAVKIYGLKYDKNLVAFGRCVIKTRKPTNNVLTFSFSVEVAAQLELLSTE
jgi:hypothetical protein